MDYLILSNIAKHAAAIASMNGPDFDKNTENKGKNSTDPSRDYCGGLCSTSSYGAICSGMNTE